MSFGRLERPQAAQPMSEINMTPLIDVMLVLLVIFIITAPLMASSLKLDLPKSDAGQPNATSQFVSVALDAQGRFFFADEALDATAFTTRLQEAARKNPQVEVQLRADQGVSYGRVAELIGMVQKAGLSRVGFVTESAPEGGAAPSASGDAAAAPVGTPAAGADRNAGTAAGGRQAPPMPEAAPTTAAPGNAR